MKSKVKCIIVFAILLFAFILMSNKPTFGFDYNCTYNICNKNSGKYLNVNYGTDANGTNVTQYTNDGSIEQKFAVVYDSTKAAFRFFPVCSDEGFGRVLDVLRTGGSASGNLQSGCNVDIWNPTDNDAQYWIITDRGNGYYSIHLQYNQNLALTSYGTGNGSGAGTSPTSTGNVFVSTYTGANNQLWSFIDTPVLWNEYLADTSKHLDWAGTSNYLTEFINATLIWNAYKPGVIRAVATYSNDLDVTISDYYAVGTTVAVTSTNRTMKFNTYHMSGYATEERINACLHEIGHALGLDHRHEIDSVMYRFNSSYIITLNYMDKWNYDKSYLRF